MHLKLKPQLLPSTNPALPLSAILIVGLALVVSALASETVLAPAALLSELASAGTGLALLSFLGGVALSFALIVRPMRQAHHARVAQLRLAQERLEAENFELHRQATSDDMLGIANRREFERVLELEWRRAARERQPLSLLMIDVDHFKTYNDTYGHLAGDLCLQQVAAALKDTTERPGDLVARYGGEEIAILLPRTGLDGATHMAQRIHAKLAERAHPFAASPVADHVTVSIGAASLLPVRNSNAHSLIQQADEGLYAAKESGRNRTEVVGHLRLIASVA